jgi:hypothetical protein
VGLDVRLPIGALFTVLGLVLATFGVTSEKAIYARSLGININLVWGLVMLGFGLIMLFLGRRALANGDPRTPTRDRSPEEKGKILRPGKGM